MLRMCVILLLLHYNAQVGATTWSAACVSSSSAGFTLPSGLWEAIVSGDTGPTTLPSTAPTTRRGWPTRPPNKTARYHDYEQGVHTYLLPDLIWYRGEQILRRCRPFVLPLFEKKKNVWSRSLEPSESLKNLTYYYYCCSVCCCCCCCDSWWKKNSRDLISLSFVGRPWYTKIL